MKRLTWTYALALWITLSACQTQAPQEPQDQAQWMVDNAQRYLTDRAWRRQHLETSLWRPELPYARKRLDSYGLERGGWDKLQTIAPTVAPVRADGQPSDVHNDGQNLLPQQLPTTVEGWRALGKEVFWKMPMRRDAYMEWIAQRPELWDDVGLQTDKDGNIRGLTRFEDARGNQRVGLTCGICHGDNGVAGKAARQLDLGHARALFSQALGNTPGTFEDWGPGRVDVTSDSVDDPLTIKNLWGVPHQSHINTSGSIQLHSPAALAVRFETQFIVGHAMEARPNRALMWALAIYIVTLDRPQTEPQTDTPGADVFQTRCAGCHNPQRGYSGDLVNAEALTSSQQSARSPLRGTGFYKTPSLLGISSGGPYLHDGSQPTLGDLLDSGHPFGQPLPEDDKHTLLQFLQTL